MSDGRTEDQPRTLTPVDTYPQTFRCGQQSFWVVGDGYRTSHDDGDSGECDPGESTESVSASVASERSEVITSEEKE